MISHVKEVEGILKVVRIHVVVQSSDFVHLIEKYLSITKLPEARKEHEGGSESKTLEGQLV